MSNVYRQAKRFDEGCPECGHEEHEVCKCKQCNCGQSDVVHSTGSDFYVTLPNKLTAVRRGGKRSYRSGTE